MQIAHELFAIRVGAEEGIPLVTVHAGPGESHDVLRPHFDRLGARRPVIFYDQRGGGRSVSSKVVGWEGHVADLDSLRSALGVDRIDLLGFSWGAMLAALYASEHREHVSRLILVSPPGKGEPHARPEVDAFLRELGDDDGPAARFARKAAPWLVEPRKVVELSPVERAGPAATAAESSLRGWDVNAKLASLRGLPILVVQGAEDPARSTLSDVVGGRLVSIANAGHAPFVEAKEEFFAAVESFLE